MVLLHDYSSRRGSVGSQSRNLRMTVLKNLFKKMALMKSLLRTLLLLFIVGSVLLFVYWRDSASESSKPSSSFTLGSFNTHIVTGGSLAGLATGDGSNARITDNPISPIERSWTYKCVNNRCVRHHFVDGVEENFDSNNLHAQSAQQQQPHAASGSTGSTASKTAGGKRIPYQTCAMTCGPINIWPQPTGATTIGSKTSRFRLSDMRLKVNTAAGFEAVERLLHDAFDVFRSELRGILVARGATLEEIEGAMPANAIPPELRNGVPGGATVTANNGDAAARDGADAGPGIPANGQSANEKYKGGALHFFTLVSDKRYDVDTVEVSVHVEKSAETYLTLHTDERYNMSVTHSARVLRVKISAHSFFGAKHGLTTLQQLIWFDDEERTLKMLNKASIEDVPKFNYRGLMLDTSRHYFSVDAIKRAIVGMSHSKLNRFHWHITDSQSFPLVSKHYPQLARYGAYSEHEVYTPDDVRELTAFAKVRGIQIIPEIDAPAHAGNGWDWGPKHGLGELSLCINQQPWSNYCGEPPCGQLNPKNNNTFLILQRLYEELLEIVGPLDYFHLGGDEVNLECWQQHFNDSDMRALWCDFMQQTYHRLQLAAGNNASIPRTAAVWSSGLTSFPCLPRNVYAVQVWGGSKWPENFQLINAGYNLVISHVDAWYLDCGFGSWRSTGEAACSPYRNWQTVYKHRPWDEMKLTSLQMRQILGGEACLWTEQVDESILDSRLWPRASALAERLWTDPVEERYSDTVPLETYNRMSVFRNRLLELGLRAEPIFPKYCAQNQDECV
ncbi:probable beta-hexosaminidase fdl isoform X1 [Anopheles albimanus]|uniref:beta-N-acetylhexosaminidase n=2 Tax=Anopheles albimanus TaxID=7167 RepID=A0A182FHE3_ANOAL|nr:probable beta-hexosaminidase fdl isoform X1 [Anopheles albimanus]